jgi:mannosyl-oligosaccharide alpha-1,2-mannosidase
MLSIRRVWLLPGFIITCLLFYLYNNAHDASRRNRTGHSTGKLPPKTHWQPHPENYPVSHLIRPPTTITPVPIPKIQYSFPPKAAESSILRDERLAAVKESFMHSWTGYKKYAWLKDEVGPTTGYFKVTFGGWAATLVDSLDTLWIMGEKDEFENAIKALEQIDFTTSETGTLNLFETTIRYLGGFLGAYDLSGGKYPVLLEKAIQVGEMLLSAFDTPNRMPMTRWDWMRLAQVQTSHSE